MDFYLASGGYFVSCVASNPFHKEEISVFDVAYNHSFDMEYFYFLYGLPGGNAWSVDSKKSMKSELISTQ